MSNLKSTLTHGHSCRGAWSPTYYAWAGMIQRCTNPNRNNYHLYGGRGIKVCERWRLSFNAFVEDMGERPAGVSLGRIDPNGDYEPTNCAWQNDKEQSRSRRNNKLTNEDAAQIRQMRGSGLSQRQVASVFGISKTMVRNIERGAAWA